MAPTYPVGYPLHLLLAVPFVGLDWAVVLVNVVAAGAAGVLMTALGRQFGLPWGWSLSGAAILWASPVVIYLELWAMSDVVSMVWCMTALWCMLQSLEHKSWALAAGAGLSIAVLVRPTNLLLLAPLAVGLGFRWRAWLALAAGCVPGAMFLTWYNGSLYGTALTTGYGNNSWAFSLGYLAPSAVRFALGVPLLLSPWVAGFALGLPLLGRREPRVVALLVMWLAAYTGFYAFYFFSGKSWWSVRFLLPAFPAVILAGLLVARWWIGRHLRAPWQTVTIAFLAVAVPTWEIVATHRLNAVIMKRGEIIYVQTVEWMRSHAPDNAVVVTRLGSGSFCYYSNFAIVRYELAGAANLQKLYEAAAKAGRPVYAVIADPESQEAFGVYLQGRWVEQVRHGMLVIWKRMEPVAETRN